MLKLKIKLNSNILLFILLNPLFSQGIFINNTSFNTISISGDYTKHNNYYSDYNYTMSLSYLFKGSKELNFNYKKHNNTISNDFDNWNEYYSISFRYYFKPKQIFNYSLGTKFSIPVRDESNLTSFNFMINSKFYGRPGTGMTYYPYIDYDIEYNGDYFEIIKNISKINDKYVYEDFISIGCIITFNDFWVKPYYKKNIYSNSLYEGIEIGFWDYIK